MIPFVYFLVVLHKVCGKKGRFCSSTLLDEKTEVNQFNIWLVITHDEGNISGHSLYREDITTSMIQFTVHRERTDEESSKPFYDAFSVTRVYYVYNKSPITCAFLWCRVWRKESKLFRKLIPCDRKILVHKLHSL